MGNADRMDSPSFSLGGAVALVTGAGGGIGSAICLALMSAGAIVIGSGRREPPVAARIDSWMQQDVTSADDWSRVVSEIEARYGRLDCLVHNAGVYAVENFASISIELLRDVFRVNVESVLLGLQAALPLLRRSGNHRVGGASVVTISSVAGIRGVPLNAAYSASKAAATLLSKSAAKEFALLGYPIRVNTVHPGRTNTNMMSGILSRYSHIGSGAGIEAELANKSRALPIPMDRMARPDEVAGAVVYLCSTAASYVTGSELVIDGGFNA